MAKIPRVAQSWYVQQKLCGVSSDVPESLLASFSIVFVLTKRRRKLFIATLKLKRFAHSSSHPAESHRLTYLCFLLFKWVSFVSYDTSTDPGGTQVSCFRICFMYQRLYCSDVCLRFANVTSSHWPLALAIGPQFSRGLAGYLTRPFVERSRPSCLSKTTCLSPTALS